MASDELESHREPTAWLDRLILSSILHPSSVHAVCREYLCTHTGTLRLSRPSHGTLDPVLPPSFSTPLLLLLVPLFFSLAQLGSNSGRRCRPSRLPIEYLLTYLPIPYLVGG